MRNRLVADPSPQGLLVPLLSLVSVLGPLLVVAYSTVGRDAPASIQPGMEGLPEPPLRTATKSSAPSEPPPPLRLVIAIEPSGLVIRGAEGVFASALHVPCSDGACADASAYDTYSLTTVLALVKDEFPDTQVVYLVPDAKTPYDLLVRVMDAIQQDAVRVDEHGRPRLLFPTVVVTARP